MSAFQAQHRQFPSHSISAPPPATRLPLPTARFPAALCRSSPSRYDGGGIRYLRFRSWLDGVANDAGGIGVVHYEEMGDPTKPRTIQQ